LWAGLTFIRASEDSATKETTASGLSVDIFEEAAKRLNLGYDYKLFDSVDTKSTGSYDDFVYQVYRQVGIIYDGRYLSFFNLPIK
jgi:ionotropic glutamate receptor